MRFRPNLLTLEGRDAPSATLAVPTPALMPVVAHGQYYMDTTVDDVYVGVRDASFGSLYGLNNTGQSGVTVDADIVVETGAFNGHVKASDGVRSSGFAYATLTVGGTRSGAGGGGNEASDINDLYIFQGANNGHGTHVAGTIGAEGVSEASVKLFVVCANGQHAVGA